MTAVDCAGNAAIESIAFSIMEPPRFDVAKSLVAAPARALILIEDGRSDGPARTDFVETALEPTGVPFVVAGGWEELFGELRTGSYTAILLFGDLALPDLDREEIRERIFLGDGLVTVAVGNGHQPKLEDVWGAILGGSCRDDSRPVAIAASDVGPARDLTILGRSSAIALDVSGASVIGSYTAGRCRNGAAAVTRSYGRGLSVLVGFDPSDADAATRAESESFLADLVEYVTSRQVLALPSTPIWLEIGVENLDGPVASARTLETWPDVLGLVETDPFAEPAPGGVFWLDSFAADETRTYLYAVWAPDAAASYQTHTEVSVAGEVVASADLELEVERSACDILADAIAALETIDANGCQDHGGVQPVLVHLDDVEVDCGECPDDDGGDDEGDDDDDDDDDDDGDDDDCEGGEDADDNLENVLKATQKLRTVDCAGVDEARLDLDRLVRIFGAEVVR